MTCGFLTEKSDTDHGLFSRFVFQLSEMPHRSTSKRHGTIYDFEAKRFFSISDIARDYSLVILGLRDDIIAPWAEDRKVFHYAWTDGSFVDYVQLQFDEIMADCTTMREFLDLSASFRPCLRSVPDRRGWHVAHYGLPRASQDGYSGVREEPQRSVNVVGLKPQCRINLARDEWKSFPFALGLGRQKRCTPHRE